MKVLASFLSLLLLATGLLSGQSLQSITNDVHHSGGGGGSSYTYVASSITGCFNTNTAQTKCVYALHQTPGLNHLLFCFAVWDNNSATATLADTPNGTYTAIGGPQTGTGSFAGFRAQMYKVSGTANSAATVTLTVSGSTNRQGWECAEFTPSGTITADGSAYSVAAASGSVFTVGPLSTTGSTDLLLGVNMETDTISSAGSGFTGQNDTNACSYNGTVCTTGQNYNGTLDGLVEYKLNVAAGSNSVLVATGGATDAGINGMAAFK